MNRIIISISIVGIVALSGISRPLIAIDRTELVQAFNQITVEDIATMSRHIDTIAKDSARNTGYVKGFPTGGGGGVYLFFPNASGLNASNTTQSGNLTQLVGGAGGFVTNLSPEWGIGGLFGGMGGSAGKKVGTDYHEFSVGASFQMVQLRYKPIITPQWIIDFQIGAGILHGGYFASVTNEQLAGTDILRTKAITPAFIVGADFRYRITPTMYVGTTTGYFAAKLENLQRAGFTDSGTSLDFSGGFVAITMGGNF